jgi:two-component system, LytTR family, response regulator
MSESIRVLIVDDERLAREGVRALAAAEPDVQVVGECGDGEAAVTTLRRGGIDVLLLDVQMPGMDGFGVLRALPEESLPVVIFLTAFDQHALKAFEAQALDYVVKPFSDERFRKAMERARRQVHQRRLGRATNELAALVSSLRSPSNVERSTSDVNRETGERRFLARIPVRSIGKVAYVKVSDIAWIGAADYYAELHTMDGKTHLVRESMQSLEERLDPAAFQRVHRSAIVNLEQVAEIRTDSAERQFVVLRDGTRLPLGRSRRDALEGALDRK